MSGSARREIIGYGLVLLAAACFATGGLLARWLFVGSEVSMDPVELSAARAVTAALILLLWVGVTRREALRIKRTDLLFMVAFGIAGQALLHLSYYQAIEAAGVAAAILLEYLAPVIVLVASVVFLGDRPTWTLPVGVVLAVVGLAFVVGILGGGGLNVGRSGIAWGLAAAGFYATYMLMGRAAADRFSAWTLLTWGLGVAAVFWLAVAGPSSVVLTLSDPAKLAAVLYTAVVSTILPFGFFLAALRHLDATRAGVTATIEPVLAGGLAWVALGESLGVLQVVGAVLVLGAIVVIQIGGHPGKKPEPFSEMPPGP